MISIPARPAASPDVVTIGEMMVLLRTDPEIRLAEAAMFHRDVAGAQGNVAAGLARLGHRVVLATRADEAELITGAADRGSVAGWFHDRGTGVVVVKQGGRGCWASEGAGIVEQPAFAVEAIDPVGAGDAFATGFLSGLLDGADLATALRGGAAVAACCVRAAGDISGLPDRAERDRLLDTTDHSPAGAREHDVLR